MKTTYGKGPSLGDTIMEQIRRAGALCRTVALATTLLLLNAVIWPSWALAIEAERHKEQQEQARWEARHQTFEQVLRGIRDQAREQQQTINERLGEDAGIMARAARALGLGDEALATDRLAWLQEKAKEMHQQALAGFEEAEARLEQNNASARVRGRHERAVADYRQRYQHLQEQLQAVTGSASLAAQSDATAELVGFLEPFRMEKPRDPFNPDKLPWRTPDPDQTRAPANSASQLSRDTGLPLFETGTQVASSSAVVTSQATSNCASWPRKLGTRQTNSACCCHARMSSSSILACSRRPAVSVGSDSRKSRTVMIPISAKYPAVFGPMAGAASRSSDRLR